MATQLSLLILISSVYAIALALVEKNTENNTLHMSVKKLNCLK